MKVVQGGFDIPTPLSPFGVYPNPLGIHDADRTSFHPVVKFPKEYVVSDWTVPTGKREMATEEERRASRLSSSSSSPCSLDMALALENPVGFSVGRYDENRVGLYESHLFDDIDNSIDGFQGKRTIHVGIDLGGPVGTPVYAFCEGSIHKIGYNPELGDYGNVVVVRHQLSTPQEGKEDDRILYALYGHLSDDSIRGKAAGQPISRGQVLGKMGDIHENGGWFNPHVHFQLSLHPPKTHDMPGVVSLEDRPKALIEYPDPRYVLGPLY